MVYLDNVVVLGLFRSISNMGCVEGGRPTDRRGPARGGELVGVECECLDGAERDFSSWHQGGMAMVGSERRGTGSLRIK